MQYVDFSNFDLNLLVIM